MKIARGAAHVVVRGCRDPQAGLRNMAQVERDHDCAQTGVALIIDLDLVQGYAGLSPTGPIEPVRMMRGAS